MLLSNVASKGAGRQRGECLVTTRARWGHWHLRGGALEILAGGRWAGTLHPQRCIWGWANGAGAGWDGGGGGDNGRGGPRNSGEETRQLKERFIKTVGERGQRGAGGWMVQRMHDVAKAGKDHVV